MRTIPIAMYQVRVALLALGLATHAASYAQTHKLRVTDPALAAELAGKGNRLIADYGSFQFFEANQPGPARGAEVRDDYNLVHLHAARLDTTRPDVQGLRKAAGSFTGKQMHLIQFAGPVRPEWRADLVNLGVQVIDYIPENAYLVYGDAGAMARLQNLAGSASHVQWEGAYQPDYRIQPGARPFDAQGSPRNLGTDLFEIQLVADAEANAATLALIDRLKLEPLRRQSRVLRYLNIVVRLRPESVIPIAAQPDVISIQPYFPPRKLDERQDQIAAGNLTGNAPTGPGYLAWLASKGFTQAQFDASGFAVDVTDSGIDNGTTAPGHFGLYALGDTNNASRVLYNRLEGTPNSGSTLAGCDGHGTLNSHIVAAYNNLSNGFPHADSAGFLYDLGICPFVKVGSSVVFDPRNFTNPDYADLLSRAYHDGARISNNSWGYVNGSGEYTSDSQTYDALVRDAQPSGAAYSVPGNQEMVVLFSDGDDGPAAQTVPSPSTAKNVIAVGASEGVRSMSPANGGNTPSGSDGCALSDANADNANDIASFSGRGPCADGRIKPDLVAPGSHITGGVPQTSPPPSPGGTGNALACYDANGVCGLPGGGTTGSASNFFPVGQQFYTESSGTSHSTPCVAGACALLRQYFINNSLTPPSPAMTKAYLMNSARYLTGSSANDTLWSNNQGMGGLDLGRAFDGVARFLRDQVSADKFVATGQDRTFTGTISNPSKPFRVTLAWTDAPGSTTGNAYNNDLDLTVTVGGNTYRGNVFSGRYSTTGGSADAKNNVESVFLPAGTTGSYTITITAANINSDGVPGDADPLDQDFALVAYNGTTAGSPDVRIEGATFVAEGCGPANGAVDPGEIVTVDFALVNIGVADTTNLVATLQAGGGVTSPSGPQTYGVLVAGGVAVSKSFTFTANGPCGGVITNSFQLQDGTNTLGTVAAIIQLGQTSTNLAENFDGVAAPALPSGWSTSAGGAESLWTTATDASDTAPNAAFSPAPANIGSNALVSPVIPVTSSSARLTFRSYYILEAGTGSVGYDGGVLEIKIGSGPFRDILTAGGSFVAGGYDHTISTGFGNPLRGRQAWSGDSGTFITTIVNLPSAAAGNDIRFRWVCGTDRSGSDTGWFIDTISVTEPACCVPGPVLAKSASPDPVNIGETLTYTIAVTNKDLVAISGVTVTDALPSSVSFNSVAASQGSCTNINGVVICALGTVASNAVATVTINVVPHQPGSLVNTATGTGGPSSATVTVVDPFASRAGQFTGLVGNGAGILTLTLGNNGAFTGKLIYGGATFTIKGTFDSDGHFSTSITPKGGPPFSVILAIDLDAIGNGLGDYVITGTVDGQPLTAYHAAYATGAITPEAGLYTLLLATDQTNAVAPQGTGYAALTVGNGGTVILKGQLADGTTFKTKGLLTGGTGSVNVVTLYMPLRYPVPGTLSGSVAFEAVPGVSDCDGILEWNKPPQSAGTYYLGGFNTAVNLIGSLYTAPPKGEMALDLGVTNNNALVELSGGDLTNLVGQVVTLTSANTVTVTDPNPFALKLAINARTGIFRGSFTHPLTGKPAKLAGVLFQDQETGGGFFLGPNSSGAISLAP